ncbi:MAG TPA: polysaccharide biosynthesis/export family protein [Mucilaginibacter sp.]|jgi:polysaccharide export outer membrane protein
MWTRLLINIYVILAILLIFTSCSKKQYQPLFEQIKSIPDTTVQKSALSPYYYKIKPQDILQVRNLQNIKYIVDETPLTISNSSAGATTSLGQTYQVEEDGTVALPVIGHVAVTGLTRSEAQKLIEDIYRKNLLKDPIIELKIVNLKVTILGEIKGQGNYILIKDKTTLVELIGEAGGLTDKANEKDIKIIRGSEKNPQVIEINLDDIVSINDPKAILKSGDIIYVAQNKRAIRNDNLSSFSTIVQPVLLLLNTVLIVITLSRL